MKHTITITFHTDGRELSKRQVETIQKVAEDMRVQLESLVDGTHEPIVPYFKPTMDFCLQEHCACTSKDKRGKTCK
jgi:hypothetical protein